LAPPSPGPYSNAPSLEESPPGGALRPLLSAAARPVAIAAIVAVLAACAVSTPPADRESAPPARAGSSAPAASQPVIPVPQPGGTTADYYLSLGDSLAQGVEAGPGGASINTPHGYPDQLYAALRRGDPRLQLVKLGCSGETTATMISGRHCLYPAGSQLAAAAQFLQANAGHVTLVTLDIGANDPNSCFTSPVLRQAPPCVAGPDPATAANLATILRTLRSAAGPGVTIIGMSYYVPELPEWRYGRAGRARARLSARAGLAFDQMLSRVYAQYGVPVADVAGAFRTTDFGGATAVPRLGRLPRNVAAVCAWTFICDRRPRGPNKHPDTAGYAAIARAFLAIAPHRVVALPRVRPPALRTGDLESMSRD
jgi:lysophospholipase L1-like esterase